jgi:hypothetical protein
MRTALVVLIVLAAVDLLACGLLLAVVWIAHRRIRMAAAAAGQPIPSAAGQFAFLGILGVLGGALLYGCLWLLLRG